MADSTNCPEKIPSSSSLPLVSSISGSGSSGGTSSSAVTHCAPTAADRQRSITVRERNSSVANAGIYNEQVLILLFRCLNWDPQTLCSTACTSRRHRAVADRVLFYEMCLSRAPQLVSSLLATRIDALPRGTGGSAPRLPGGWPALAKMLLYCGGCSTSMVSDLSRPVPGHFTPQTRFSKTSGKSFLARRCWGDLLFVSDPCEHGSPQDEDHDLGLYRGIFSGFVRSRIRACLIGRNVELEEHVRCPYCSARVWSMAGAGLVPRSAARRLGSLEDGVEYFICVNGHLHGCCWLARLSSNSEGSDNANCEDDGSNSGGDADEM